MSDRKIIYSSPILQLEASRRADPEIVAHIKSAVLGTPGRLRYQHGKIEEKLAHIKDIYFIVLCIKDKILGSIGLLKRKIPLDNEFVNSWYIRYFSIRAPLRSGAQKKERYRERDKGINVIRNFILPYIERPSMFGEDYDPEEKSLVYGYVERGNFRSMNFSGQMRAVTVRKYQTFVFSRFVFDKSDGFRRLKSEELPEMKKRIQQFYKDYKLFTGDNLFINNNYFVLERKGEIIAGAQVHPEFWRILEMRAKFSKFLLRILPCLPYVRNYFNPERFRFLAVEGIWYKEGHEQELNKLFENICNHFKTHFAMTWVDTECDLFHKLEQHLDCGFTGSAFGKNEVDVRITFNNFSVDEKKEFFEKPAYISAYDMV